MADLVRMRGPELQKLLNSPNGDVGRYLLVKTDRVLTRAQGYCGVSDGEGPHLRDSLHKRVMSKAGKLVVLIGSSLAHALFHHDDTKPHVILPKKAKWLVFEADGDTVFTGKVNHPGTTGTKYLERAAVDEGFHVRMKRTG